MLSEGKSQKPGNGTALCVLVATLLAAGSCRTCGNNGAKKDKYEIKRAVVEFYDSEVAPIISRPDDLMQYSRWYVSNSFSEDPFKDYQL